MYQHSALLLLLAHLFGGLAGYRQMALLLSIHPLAGQLGLTATVAVGFQEGGNLQAVYQEQTPPPFCYFLLVKARQVTRPILIERGDGHQHLNFLNTSTHLIFNH